MVKGKVLLINPIQGIDGFLPLGISIISGALKKAGYETALFDATFYDIRSEAIADEHTRKVGESILEFKKSNIAEYTQKKTSDYKQDLLKQLKEFKPDVVGLSLTTSNNHYTAMHLLNIIRPHFKGPIIVGGYVVTVATEKIIAHQEVDAVCVGEGETAIIEFCDKVMAGQEPSDIKSIWYKRRETGEIVKNGMRNLPDPNDSPYPDWDIFEDSAFYKPFLGNVYRSGHVEMSRGCPYQCTYCIEPTLQKQYRGLGTYHRRKTPHRMIKELKYLKEKYNLQMFKFWDGTFLLFPPGQLEEFAKLYHDEIGLPFFITTRAETASQEKNVQLLKQAGCVCVSFGIESGSPNIRQNVLNRWMSNEQIINAFKLLRKYKIRISGLNMMGLPYETREDVLQTIKLNKIAGADSSRPNIFQPYEGTPLRELAIKEGWINPEDDEFKVEKSMLKMPQLTPEEIHGLKKVFILYKEAPEWLWPVIKLCEKDGPVRNALYMLLNRLFYYKIYGKQEGDEIPVVITRELEKVQEIVD
ncbi:MAG: B12-binding domain-containing radical SAM protein [DPANN group archaeon]|nr:B12-binding domain-containing radical SAM protein [DPANN group archaeon]